MAKMLLVTGYVTDGRTDGQRDVSVEILFRLVKNSQFLSDFHETWSISLPRK